MKIFLLRDYISKIRLHPNEVNPARVSDMKIYPMNFAAIEHSRKGISWGSSLLYRWLRWWYKPSSSLLLFVRLSGWLGGGFSGKGGGNKDLEFCCLLQAKLSQVRRKRRYLKSASAQSEEVSIAHLNFVAMRCIEGRAREGFYGGNDKVSARPSRPTTVHDQRR